MQAWHLSSLWWTLPGISRSSSIPQARGTHYLLQVRAYLLSEAVSKRSWACYEGISALGFQTVIFKQDIEEKLIASAESGFQDEQCHLCTLLLKNLGLLSFSAGPKGQWKNESKFSRRLTSPAHDVQRPLGIMFWCFDNLYHSTHPDYPLLFPSDWAHSENTPHYQPATLLASHFAGFTTFAPLCACRAQGGWDGHVGNCLQQAQEQLPAAPSCPLPKCGS